MAKPTPGLPEVMVPRSCAESPSKSAVRCSTTSLSQNQCGPGCSASVRTLPTASGSAARPATTAVARHANARTTAALTPRTRRRIPRAAGDGTRPHLTWGFTRPYEGRVSWETWSLFAVTETRACPTPGPAVLFVLSHGLGRGAGASLWASLGILAGTTFYFVLSATSLGAMLVASYDLFFAIKWAGAAYPVL